jgi:hypothetical protein
MTIEPVSPRASTTSAANLFQRMWRVVMFLTLGRVLLAAGLGFVLSGIGWGQAPAGSATPQPTPPPEGVESGGYRIHQSIELGYRVNEITGSGEMYNTLVNQHSGLRVFDQSLTMQSTTHESLLFDNMYANSFGWGGEPSNALLLRLDKNKWYDFRTNFRRDQNYFDYDLLANPLNPSTSSPTIPVNSSPHTFATTRRMTDIDLTLLPQSKITFRLGYSHNNMSGPSNGSVHEGTDALLSQPWNTTLNSYRIGADLKILPRTVVSYDQFLDYYKGDTTLNLATFAPALLPGGAGSVELGLPMDTVGGSPCKPTAPATSLIDSTGTLTNIACNAFFSYNRADRVRTSNPTERISLRSHYFERLELTASFAYSEADMNSQFNEFFNGLVSRSETRQSTVTGPPQATRVSDVADFTATLYLTHGIRVVDTFRFWAFRIPESFASSETDWIIPVSGSCAPPTCSLLIPISGTVPTTTASLTTTSFNQNWKRNETDLIWDANRHLGARVGFRYGSQAFTHVNDFATDDVDYIPVNEYTVLFGIWARPIHTLRFNFDLEHSNYDNTIVRIGPRKEGRYRIQANYTPKPWAVLGGSINLLEQSNGDALVNYQGHNRNYGFTASLAPKERFGVELAYNYDDYQQNAFICFNDTPPAGVTLPVVTDAGDCTQNINPNNPYDDSSNPLLTNGFYTNKTNYALATVRFQPIPRITTQIGYSITSVSGTTPQFNVLQPLGPLAYNYHLPLANVAVDIGHDLTVKMGWNYYQYGEGSFVGPTNSRYFHANNATFALRWGF